MYMCWWVNARYGFIESVTVLQGGRKTVRFLDNNPKGSWLHVRIIHHPYLTTVSVNVSLCHHHNTNTITLGMAILTHDTAVVIQVFINTQLTIPVTCFYLLGLVDDFLQPFALEIPCTYLNCCCLFHICIVCIN